MIKIKGNFNVAMCILYPNYQKHEGMTKITYSDPEDTRENRLIFCEFKSYGGTDAEVNGIYTVLKTAKIRTWYRPDITQDCALKNLETGEVYQIKGIPENFEMRNMYLEIKVEKIENVNEIIN